MIKTKFEKALEVAAVTHVEQKRKGTNIPYIVHPIGVMLIASRVTTDENTLCACLLHDVLEDGDLSKYGKDDMLRDFGKGVTDAVQAVTKDESIKSWRQRNEAYIIHLRQSKNIASLTVCAADKIHNLKSVLVDFDELGDDLWQRFNAGKEDQKWWYRSVLTTLKEESAPSSLVDELSGLVDQLEAL